MQYRWETPRLLIRPYRLEDGDAVWRVVRRPEIYATTYAIPRNYPRAGGLVDCLCQKQPGERNRL